MRKFFSVWVAVAALVFVVGCFGSKLTAENLEKVKSGMSKDEVIGILGQPTEQNTGGLMGNSGTTFLYKQDGKEVSIVFINDEVTVKQGSF